MSDTDSASEEGVLLGYDIGGTKIAAALSDREGEILARSRRPTELSGDPRRDIERLVDDARALLAQTGRGLGDLVGAGASVPGPFDPVRGMLLNPPNMPGWRDVPVRDWLSAGLGCPVALENDANAAALAEARFGAGVGADSVVYLTMSTGIGGGLVLGGRVHHGAGAGAGEVGHIPVEWNGDLCKCGLHGCLEAYAGGRAWMQRLQRIAPESSGVAKLAGGRANARAEHVVLAAREGDPFALSEMARFNDYLARGIVQLAFTLDPAVVVLGTIAVAAGEELCFAPVRRIVREHLWSEYADRLQIVPAALGDDLPYRAALCAAELAVQA